MKLKEEVLETDLCTKDFVIHNTINPSRFETALHSYIIAKNGNFPRLFRSITTYSEPCQISKGKCFAKIVDN